MVTLVRVSDVEPLNIFKVFTEGLNVRYARTRGVKVA